MKLDEARLQVLETQWRSRGAGLVANLRPGLPGDKAREVVAPLRTVVLTDELLSWWGWHDGVERQDVTWYAPGREFISLDYAVELTEADRTVYDMPTYLRLTTVATYLCRMRSDSTLDEQNLHPGFRG